MKRFLISAVILTSSVFAHANILPIDDKSQANEVAATANDIYGVWNLKIGTTAYKVVAMDSRLNGDLNQTVMLLVGQGAVGGLAGYDAAFQLAPVGDRNTIRLVNVEGDRVVLTFLDFSGKANKLSVRYDAAKNVLVEL